LKRFSTSSQQYWKKQAAAAATNAVGVAPTTGDEKVQSSCADPHQAVVRKQIFVGKQVGLTSEDLKLQKN